MTPRSPSAQNVSMKSALIFPGQLLRLNWRHPDPDKIAESRIDRLQQTRIMRDSIKADVINFIDEYKAGKFPVLLE